MSIWDATYTSRGRPLLIAHRGGMSAARENTRAAFEASHLIGADVIETDLRLTEDGVPVCLHDEWLIGVSNTRRSVAEITFEELRGIDPDIPRFLDIVAIPAAFYLDLKDSSLASKLALLRELHARDDPSNWIVGVDSAEHSRAIGSEFPRLRQVALMHDRAEIAALANRRPGSWVRVHELNVSASLFKSLRDEGLRIMVTCGGNGRPGGVIELAGLAGLLDFHPDALIVNDVAMAIGIFEPLARRL